MPALYFPDRGIFQKGGWQMRQFFCLLVVFSLVDLFKPERRVIGDNKLVWALVIVVVGTIGPIVYLLGGRKQN